MPTPRGSVVLCDLVDLHGDSLRCLIRAADDVTSDGFTTPDERQLLRNLAELVMETYAPIPCGAAQQDNAFRVIGAAAGAARVTPYVERVVREAAADAA